MERGDFHARILPPYAAACALASVFAARDALDPAERDVDSGLAMGAAESADVAPLSIVACTG
jgi:hypothetical protein